MMVAGIEVLTLEECHFNSIQTAVSAQITASKSLNTNSQSVNLEPQVQPKMYCSSNKEEEKFQPVKRSPDHRS